MLIDYREPALPRGLPASHPGVEPSSASGRSVVVLEIGRDSLAVSLDQANLRMALFELGWTLVGEPANTMLPGTMLGKFLFPAVIDKVCFEAQDYGQRKLEARLRGAFEDTPLEDGIDHPAEPIIDEALRSVDGQRVLGWLRALSVAAGHPELAASVLRCLGRRGLGTPAWRAETVQAALATEDVEMRDAAVQAAESWGGLEVRDVLRSHVEPIPWLREYIEDVVEDLGA